MLAAFLHIYNNGHVLYCCISLVGSVGIVFGKQKAVWCSKNLRLEEQVAWVEVTGINWLSES